jgi:hypothetical protein
MRTENDPYGPVQPQTKRTTLHSMSKELLKIYTGFMISRFRRDIDEICALLGYYATSNGNLLPTFRDVSKGLTFDAG